jgi:hypothetical protein
MWVKRGSGREQMCHTTVLIARIHMRFLLPPQIPDRRSLPEEVRKVYVYLTTNREAIVSLTMIRFMLAFGAAS